MASRMEVGYARDPMAALLFDFATAIFIGVLVGLEREHSHKPMPIAASAGSGRSSCLRWQAP